MNHRTSRCTILAAAFAKCLFASVDSIAADHNDPNAVNSIFSDVDVSAADLYDIFGFPSDDSISGEKAVIALTFASIPEAGVFDPDLLYRIRIYPAPRVAPPLRDDQSLEAMLKHFESVREKYLHHKAAEIRVTVNGNKANIDFLGFPSGRLSTQVATNRVVNIEAPEGLSIKTFIGGRDDAFFNDLPGFFRSINYAPQFYHIPYARQDLRELKIPKTLIELEGNTLFNFNPAKPRLGQGVKEDLPDVPLTWSGNQYFKDANGNYRFVYSGKDAQAGKNVNAIILEIPLSFITRTPQTDRIVNTWGESWVRRASHKVPNIDVDRQLPQPPLWVRWPWLIPSIALLLGILLIVAGGRKSRAGALKRQSLLLVAPGVLLIVLAIVGGWILRSLRSTIAADNLAAAADQQLRQYKLVDTDGQAFADAALNERENDRQLGADNFWLGPQFILRLAHLGWGFGPSVTALGLKTSFDHGNSLISIHRTYRPEQIGEAFHRVKRLLFQELNMPDDSWNKRSLNIPLRRPFEIFIPNVCAIDMDTTGTWPFGRRLEDQVATRFLSLFLDMSATLNGKKYDLELLNQQSLWDQVNIEPKTPPNPRKNDKPFLKQFPYLAEPW